MQGMISKYGLPYLAVCHVTFKLGKTKKCVLLLLKILNWANEKI